VENRFQRLPFKCNLQRYTGATSVFSVVKQASSRAGQVGSHVVGLCTLNQVDP
jgi:hypothetical protein